MKTLDQLPELWRVHPVPKASEETNQPRLQCKLCELSYHLKCLGADYELTSFCRQCSAPADQSSETTSSEELLLPSKLREVMKLRGFKFFHQNIQSLKRKIDEIRLILQELNAGMHLLALAPKLGPRRTFSTVKLISRATSCIGGTGAVRVVELRFSLGAMYWL